MEPLIALGLASSIIQIVDFSGRVISRSKEIYTSDNGTLKIHGDLEEAAKNLQELSHELIEDVPPPKAYQSEDKRERREMRARGEFKWVGPIEKIVEWKTEWKETQQQRMAEKQLLALSVETKKITDDIIHAIQQLKSNSSSTRFQSVRHAFRSIWGEERLKCLETGLESIRRQIDTALLFSLRKQLHELDTRKLSISEGEFFDFIKDFDSKHEELLDAISSDTRTKTLESRHNELMKEITADRTVSPNTANELTDQVGSLVQSEFVSRFKKNIHARLKFADMPDRLDRIPKAHQNTFAWVFRPPEDHPENGSWDNFADWLRSTGQDHIYWITGKPGSGKSTLMKFLYSHNQTLEDLKAWSGTTATFHAGFFFWNSGTPMQMSRTGLLQTLLYELTQQVLERGTDPLVIERIFSDRWAQFESCVGGREPFTWPELKRSFEALIADTSKNFFLAIDGLDEFDGDPQEMIDLILDASSRTNVKICTASRPWPIFEDAFHNRPSLLLEQLTRPDIRNYVTSRFDADRHFIRLVQHEKQHAMALVRDIIDKASGVFLWVYLVVGSLLQGISNADKMSELQARLEALPSDLEDLFDKLLHKVEPMYYRQACQLIRLMEEQTSPTLLELSFADDDDLESAMSAQIRPLLPEELDIRHENMKRRLNSRCKGLLEVYEYSGTNIEPGLTIGETLKVGYLHRTAREYFRSERIRHRVLDATNQPPFNPCQNWANGFLWSLKTIEPKGVNTNSPSMSLAERKWYAWRPLTLCMSYALKLQGQDGHVRRTYLDEVGRAGFQELQECWKLGLVVAPRQFESFIELATYLGLEDYVCIKLRTMTIVEVKQVLKAISDGNGCWIVGGELLREHDALACESSNDIVKVLRYRSKSPIQRAFSSKPKETLLPYV